MNTTYCHDEIGTSSGAIDDVPDDVGEGGLCRSPTGDRRPPPLPRADPDEVNRLPDDVPDGTEHFSLWLKEPGKPAPRFVTAWMDEPWPEFVPGVHYDIRQPSRLRGLCSPRK